MTRPASTLVASVAFGLMMTSTALAQSAPETTTTTKTTTTTADDQPTEGSTTTTTTPGTVDVDAPDVDVDAPDVDVDAPDVDVDAPDVDVAPPQPTYVSTPTPVVIDDDDDYYYYEEPLFSGIGIAIAAGGGAGGFVEEQLRDTAEVGGDWDVRATIGTRSPLAFEASYIGSAQGIDALGLDDDALLIGNGLQGALRLNATTDMAVQPFLFAGLGWRHYELDFEGANLSAVSDDDDVLEIPLGLGIAGSYQGLILDARGEFRATTNEDLVPELRGDEDEIELDDDSFGAMHRWGVKATVGFEF